MNHASPGAPAWVGGVLTVLLGVFTYLFGLDGAHIPKNGDEYPYEHITRLTAASGALLPLRSQLPAMRNTKPPLLFWQGIASTDWGRHWTLARLRYPSVLYTLITALLVLLLGWKLSGQLEAGVLALLNFLAFFSTYRYGRPFLTNPPEVFWLFLPFFVLLYWRPLGFRSRLAFPILSGFAVGVGLLYKSFALAVPVALGLGWWYLRFRDYRAALFLAEDARKVAITISIALVMFSSWFLLDPDPRSVWAEFVLGENLGKLGPHGYLRNLVWGASSLWSLALAYPLNAGLLALPVAELFASAYRRRRELGEEEALLWIWVVTLWLVYAVPSQRSGRYLLPAMPALAVLLALNWSRIGHRVFAATLAATAVLVAAIAYLSVRLNLALPDLRVYPAAYWIFIGGALAFLLVTLLVPAWTRGAVHAGVLLAFLSLTFFLRPFDGPLGRYDFAARRSVEGREVWVPRDFVAKEEGYRFLLAGAEIRSYAGARDLTVADLVAQYPLVAVQVPLLASGCDGCRILGQRLEIRGRQSPREVGQILLGNVDAHLFVKELLVQGGGVSAPGSSATGPDR